jgi:hypothetical protein
VSDPIALIEALDLDAQRLDQLEKLIENATDALDEAEARWDEEYDKVAESLKDDMAREGRKGDPAEHWITATTRREHRTVYETWRRARRAVERIEKQIKAKQAAQSGRQSALAALRDEARSAQAHAPGQGRGIWDRSGGRRAA